MLDFDTMHKSGTFNRVANFANTIVEMVAEHYGEGRTGCVLTFFDQSHEVRRFIQYPIGVIDPSKIHLYHKFSLEKPTRAARLGRVNSYMADHDPENGRHAGDFLQDISTGVRSSVSGFEQLDDVAFNAYVNYVAGSLTLVDVFRIFSEHGYVENALQARFATLEALCNVYETDVD